MEQSRNYIIHRNVVPTSDRKSKKKEVKILYSSQDFYKMNM